MKLTATQLRRIIREEVSKSRRLSETGYKTKHTDPDAEIMDNDDIKEFANSDQLARACEAFCKSAGINEWMGFHDTVSEWLNGID